MKKLDQTWTRSGYTLRLAKASDAEDYYQNFNPLDPELCRLTGSKPDFTRDEVIEFFHQCLDADDRYDFLLLAPDGRIIGESVINEIDWDARCANFRIGIFQPTERGKGIGSWAVAATRDFAFEQLKLHRLELNVFSFNPRALHTYLKAGFHQEGVLRDAILDGTTYGDDIIMSILEDEWLALKS